MYIYRTFYWPGCWHDLKKYWFINRNGILRHWAWNGVNLKKLYIIYIHFVNDFCPNGWFVLSVGSSFPTLPFCHTHLHTHTMGRWLDFCVVCLNIFDFLHFTKIRPRLRGGKGRLRPFLKARNVKPASPVASGYAKPTITDRVAS